ncbi:hypothetical protein [Thorsellia anophelis]|uniref:Uncharacterized protein n=1 Tax=Thorsellia anophelis DSM 18579 TaxID=1123402 RepID=A0A1I0BJ89_9GAMM|nr:hypothetical protein [Thorsellia anophelis]SET06621.1 hypothetical protein SAMN02583745_01267 [Thorsellia anophelis DSM 18579]
MYHFCRFFCSIFYSLILLSVFTVQSAPNQPALNFQHTERTILVNPAFLQQLVKSSGKLPISSYRAINGEIATEHFQFQAHSLAPFQIIANQDKLAIKWTLPKANTSELYTANAENNIIAKNVARFLFGSDQLISKLNENHSYSTNLLSENQIWRISAVRAGVDYSIIIIPN